MKHIKTCLLETERQRRTEREHARPTFHPSINFGDNNRADDAGAAQTIAAAPRASRRRQAWQGLADAPATNVAAG